MGFIKWFFKRVFVLVILVWDVGEWFVNFVVL